MFSIEKFKSRYEVEIHKLMIGERKFSYYLPRSIEPFIDSEFPMNNFPLWAKVWPSALVLADFMAAQPADNGKKILEIGAGLGVAGLAASMFGHNVTISESDTHAIEFIKANAFINGCRDVTVISLDWNYPPVVTQYDQLIGSEVIFRKEDFGPIQKLFNTILKPDGEVILVSEIRKPVIEFYQNMQSSYRLTAQQKVLSSDNEKIKIIFCRMNQGSGII
jgi:predicted nicotinamide N-methyase